MPPAPSLAVRARDAVGRRRDGLEERLAARARGGGSHPDVPLEEALGELAGHLGTGGAAARLGDAELLAVEHEVDAALAAGRSPHPEIWASSHTLARLAYVAVRLVRPDRVAEVGVAAGRTTAHLLAALDAEDHGTLDSIDPLPPDRVGALVPERLRPRWRLHSGRSRTRLPGVLAAEPPAGVFVQDGLHTAPTVAWELRRAGRRLGRGALVLADDVERHDAFPRWAAEHARWWRVVRTEAAHHQCGVALL